MNAMTPPPAAVMPTAPVSATGFPLFDACRFSVAPRLLPILPPRLGFGIARHRLAHDPGAVTEIETSPAPMHLILLVTDAEGLPFDAWIGGSFLRHKPDDGCSVVMPAGADSRWVKRARTDRVLHLHLDPAWLDRIAEEEGVAAGPVTLDARHIGHDPVLVSLAAMLDAERAQGPVRAAFAEHWAVLVALHILQATPEAARRDYAMAPHRLARVKAFIEANLARDIGLAEMAEVAGLSRFHFLRAFRRETGLAPHAFLTARRVALAKRLLEEGDGLPLASVAAAAGFGSVARFGEAFRRVAGVTPARWRGLRGA